jgi:hypothetical protein
LNALSRSPEAISAIYSLSQSKLSGAVRKICKKNFLAFMSFELGMKIGPQHKIWWRRYQQGKDQIEIAPRDHSKSITMARALPLWLAKYDDWTKRIVILGPDGSSAVENLDSIKDMLETKPSLRHLIPRKNTKAYPWSRSEIRLSNGKSIKTKAIGSPLRGRHPQLIILDDVLNEKNSWSPEARETMKNIFHKVVVPMKDKGFQDTGGKSRIVVIGTPQDPEDLYVELLENTEYTGGKLPAVLNEEKKQVLWPERYSFNDLMSLKAKIGLLAFQQEYMLEPITDQTSLFPPSLFEPLKDRTLSFSTQYRGPLSTYMGVDLSVPGSADGDWTVIAVILLDPTRGEFQLLNYWRDRPDRMKDQTDKIETWCHLFQIKQGYIEDNLFQKVYSEHFKHETKFPLPLSGHTISHESKASLTTGILGFRPLFENFKWRFPYKTPEDQQKTDRMIQEFGGFKKKGGRFGNESSHDDIVLALYHAWRAASTASSFEATFL